MARRKHSKISTLPPAIKLAVDNLLSQGFTYEQIATELEGRGYKVGKSSVGRYGKDFLARLDRVQLVMEKAQPYLDKFAEKPNMNLAQIAGQMGLMELIEYIEAGELDNEKSKASAIASICDAAARIQRSQAQAERLRLEWAEKIEAAKKEMAEAAAGQAGGLTPEKIDKIFQKLTGV